MAATSPIHFDVEHLREEVLRTYDRVARDPHGNFHFHRGPRYAVDYLGYDAQELAQLPESCTARFAGVGNPLRIATVLAGLPGIDPSQAGPYPGETVLDHACGAGMDLLLAARKVGPHGRAIGVDMTPAMRACAQASAELARLVERVQIRAGYMENLPVDDASVDLVISNGVVNLAPDKTRVFREIARVLRPGGRLYLADVVVQRELTLDARENPDLWAACVAGAMVETEIPLLAAEAGLVDGRVVQRFDCFRDTSAEVKVAKDLFIQGVNFYARRM
ncbi:methyltransferase type 11 [Thioalkalivibrio denitrificans]|uniref:Arsenite methyltransferase n=1 Tax=Thioalkalivibrio denitrificans TaxID=108003 RepID=A0A1V3NUI0_9GAMM|nr:methyltransferase domain-containing protein [Thioalkalivibrio denitrificans]OOG28775.1 methyltransferase type 11 [Thioalkalivibrio denitrificans]